MLMGIPMRFMTANWTIRVRGLKSLLARGRGLGSEIVLNPHRRVVSSAQMIHAPLGTLDWR